VCQRLKAAHRNLLFGRVSVLCAARVRENWFLRLTEHVGIPSKRRARRQRGFLTRSPGDSKVIFSTEKGLRRIYCAQWQLGWVAGWRGGTEPLEQLHRVFQHGSSGSELLRQRLQHPELLLHNSHAHQRRWQYHQRASFR
jgi:hypothetical protein